MRTPVSTSQSTGIEVRVAGIRRVFDNGVVALDGIDLEVPQGQFLAILGPSGCGKSTLLRLVAGLDRPSAGIVDVSALPVQEAGNPHLLSYRAEGPSARRGRISYVFQDAHLLPWRTVLQNVALPLELMRVGRSVRLDASRDALEQVGLAEAIDRYPAQLSGGQRMRVSLARAMVTNPRLLLLDEPFAALDEITRQRLDEQLRQLWASRGMTVIFVTHSTTEAVYLAQRAVVMTRRPGRIIHDQAVDLPAQRTAALRGTNEFAREMRAVYDALERGGA
jgi:NitT/TauT family transport system ATP-binding protein